ncbi:MAG: hypothetical protein U1F48_00965 [Burkholderiales bacterium]
MVTKIKLFIGASALCAGLMTTATVAQGVREVKAEDILITSLEAIANRPTSKVLGLYCRSSVWNGSNRVGEVIGPIFHDLRIDALQNGGNAIINVRLSYGTFAEHKVTTGPGNATYIDREAPILAVVTACGDAVVLKQ